MRIRERQRSDAIAGIVVTSAVPATCAIRASAVTSATVDEGPRGEHLDVRDVEVRVVIIGTVVHQRAVTGDVFDILQALYYQPNPRRRPCESMSHAGVVCTVAQGAAAGRLINLRVPSPMDIMIQRRSKVFPQGLRTISRRE